jgi:SAM-dependent methyltransferase
MTACEICGSSISEPMTEFFAVPLVTSDCRPWSIGKSVTVCSGCGVMHRVTSDDFSANVYSKYISYPEPSGRTEKVLKFIDTKMPQPKSILDIGSGAGHGLKVLGEHYSQAAVFGYEPHSNTLQTFRENITVLAERPHERKFDLITLFHVLEHVEDVNELLRYVKMALNPCGYLLIEVPYTFMWPFDLIIADHVWHFNLLSLFTLMKNAGFLVVHYGNNVINKELTILAMPSIKDDSWGVGKPTLEPTAGKMTSSAKEILAYKAFLDNINEPVIIYGTGPSAAWVAGILGDKVQYFIDDDICRQGVKFNGKSVFSPAWVDPGASIKNLLPIVAPFPSWQMDEIKSKNPKLRFL